MAAQDTPTARSLSNRIYRLLLVNGLAVVLLIVSVALLATIIHREGSLTRRIKALEALLPPDTTAPPPVE